MSFRIAVEGTSPPAEAVVMGLEAAQAVARELRRLGYIKLRKSAVIIEVSSRIVTHDRAWAAFKSIVNRLP